MKTPARPAFAAFLAATCALSAAPLESLEHRAEVTLPFAEVKALFEKPAPLAESVPPVAAAVTSTKVALSLDGAHPTATATCEVEIFATGWRLVPLLSAPFVLKEAVAQGATVLNQDGMLCILAKQPGHVSVVLKFDIPAALARPDAATSIFLRFAPATAGEVSVQAIPKNCLATLESDALKSTDGVLPLPLSGGKVTLRLSEDKPPMPTSWTAEAQTLIRQREDRLQVVSRLHLTGDRGSGLSATLDLPPSTTDVEIEGSDLQPVRFRTTSSGAKIAELSWGTSDVLERDLTVSCELPPPASGEPWNIRLPQLSQFPPAAARTVLVPLPGTALSGKEGRLVNDPAQLPSWMQSAAAAGGAWETSLTTPFAVASRALPRLEADTARIPKAEFRTRVVADGAQLCEARLSFQHRGPLRWRFSLPKGSELLSCEVEGRAVNPLLIDGGQLELLLSAEPDAVASSEVRLAYTSHRAAFAPVEGKLDLTLPSTPIFIGELTWSLALPEAYEATAFEGNVEPSGSGSDLLFQKRLVRNEAASVEIYYRKRNANL